MSIAVSVVVGPSLIHRLLLAGCGLAQLGAALAVGVIAPDRFPWASWLALALALAGAALLHGAARCPKTHRIDISGTGELRVTVQQDVHPARTDSVVFASQGAGRQQGVAAATGVELLPGSVMWTVLVLLRYGAPGARAGVLPVWRDSVDPKAWRALAVALAAIGRRADAGQEIDTIR
jgi:toxin CptA